MRRAKGRGRVDLSGWSNLERLGLVGAMVLALGVPSLGAAKDLSSRMGVGLTNQLGGVGGNLPSLALRYYPNRDFGVAAALGVDTEKDNSRFGFTAKLMRNIFTEDNLNYYLGASGGLISREINGDNDSGFELAGFFGVEFFLPGLDSLGFSMEAGVGVASISSEVRFSTMGNLGLIFYF